MKTILCVCALLLVTGCMSRQERIADYSTQCRQMGYIGNDVPNCVAMLLQQHEDRVARASTNMTATGNTLLSQPAVAPRTTTTCSWVGNVWVCN